MISARPILIILVLGAVLLLSVCSDDTVRSLDGPAFENDPPVLTAQPDVTGQVGDTLRLQASAVDPDGDRVLYALLVHDQTRNYTPDAAIDRVTGKCWFVPQLDDFPWREMTFIACDRFGACDSTRFRVTPSPFMWDQRNDASSTGSISLIAFAPVGQEFVPADTLLNVAQFMLGFTGTAEIRAHVRLDTMDGPIVGRSDSWVHDGASGLSTFYFAPVRLTPGVRYVLEVVHVSGAWTMISGTGNTYPDGRQIIQGTPSANSDCWFREGWEW